jgi:hypothetical protein
MLDAVLARFIEASPVAVLAQLTLQRALRAEWVDAVFTAHAEQQCTREVPFSTVVDLMALVATGLRPSLHAAAGRRRCRVRRSYSTIRVAVVAYDVLAVVQAAVETHAAAVPEPVPISCPTWRTRCASTTAGC